MICSQCHLVTDRFVKDSLCPDCSFWNEKLKVLETPEKERVAIYKGVWYEIRFIGFRDAPSEDLGHGGTKFEIAFKDGRLIETNDLWQVGVLPNYFKNLLPNTVGCIRKM